MFIDKNSKKLIEYLAEHEPYKNTSYPNDYYPISSLVSVWTNNKELWTTAYLEPHLKTLQKNGYIDSYIFYGTSSVHIKRTTLLIYNKEYKSFVLIKNYIIPICVTLTTNALIFLGKLLFM